MTRALLLAFLLLALPAQADDALTAHGKALAEKNCTTCHAVGVSGDSPLRDAPPFRDLAANYDEGELEDAFNDGVVTEHPAMPDWQMTPEQAAALASYIMSLAPHGMKKTEAQQ
jgi:cytochrome c